MTNRLSIVSAFLLTLGGITVLWAGQSFLQANNKEAIHYSKDAGSYHSVAEQVLPAVVTIEASHKAKVAHAKLPGFQGRGFFDFPGLPDELRKHFQEFEQQPFDTPDAAPQRAFGSGFLVDPKGIILTNNHVVQGADKVEVHLQDGRKFISKSIRTDPKTDLAIVRLEVKESLPYLQLGNSDAMEIGDRVLAVGAPLGMSGTVTSGIISAKGRDIHMNMYEDFLQTDAAINPGNSGGPLVNLEGKVIGINSAIKSRTGGFQGIGLAVSSNLTKTVMAQLLKDGSVHRGYLGVQISQLSPEIAERLGIADHEGVVVGKVGTGTPAAKAGLQGGDIITSLAGKTVKDGRSLQSMVAQLPSGKPVEMTVWREGQSKKLQVVIAEQPKAYGLADSRDADSGEQQAEPSKLDKLGLNIAALTPEQAKHFGYPADTSGVVTVGVEQGSVADEAGLRNGNLILKVDGQAVHTVKDATAALEKGSLEKGILVEVKDPEAGMRFVLLKASN
jgi:serine protease Do